MATVYCLCHAVWEGMEVLTNSLLVRNSRKHIIEPNCCLSIMQIVPSAIEMEIANYRSLR